MITEVRHLLPHREPMIMIESLVHVESACATATRTFLPGDYGVCGEHVLEPMLIECLAQTVAALQGYHARQSGKNPSEGMLVSVSNFEIHRLAAVSCELEFEVNISRSIGPFCIAAGRIRHGDELIAEGSLKFYIVEPDSQAGKVP